MKALQLSQGAVVSHFKNSHTWLFFSPSCWGFLDSSAGKESACSTGDPSSIPGSGRSPREGNGNPLQYSWASLVAQLGKTPPAMQETWVPSLDRKNPLKKGMATPTRFLACRIPMDRGACQATIHGVTKSQTRLHFHFFHVVIERRKNKFSMA